MESTQRKMQASQLNIEGFDSFQRTDPKTARYFRITFPEKGKPVLNIGPGDQTLQRWTLTMEDLRGLVLDAMPEVLK
jgi:hypothetical protein